MKNLTLMKSHWKRKHGKQESVSALLARSGPVRWEAHFQLVASWILKFVGNGINLAIRSLLSSYASTCAGNKDGPHKGVSQFNKSFAPPLYD
jgi:hypothetical protein